MVFTLRSIQYACMEKNFSLDLGFIDIAKANVSVHQPTLLNILYEIGILPKMLSLTKTLYSKNNCKIKFGNKFSEPFTLLEGLKQGCPAACIFFNIFFAIVILVIKEKLQTKGIILKFRFDGDIFDLKRLYAIQKFRKFCSKKFFFCR